MIFYFVTSNDLDQLHTKITSEPKTLTYAITNYSFKCSVKEF